MINDMKHQLDKINQPIGIVKKHPRDVLPANNYVYGKPNERNKEGVSKALGEWKEHTPSPAPIYKKQPVLKATSSNNTGLLSQSKPCGIPSGRHDPIKGIIYNEAGNQAEINMKKHYEDYFNKLEKQKKRGGTLDFLNKKSKPSTYKGKGAASPPKESVIKPERKKKLEMPQMASYDNIESQVKKGMLKFKTYTPKSPKPVTAVV